MSRYPTKARIRTKYIKHSRKEEEAEEETVLRDENVDVELLLGDGKAKIGSTMTYRRGVDYNSTVFGLNCWVELSCNQDNGTIERAQKTATNLAATEIARNQEFIDKIVGDDK